MACCSVVLGVAGLLAACENGRPVPPTAPTGGSSPTTFLLLSGKVTETTAAGPVPVAEVLVREAASGQFGITDAGGRYQIDRVSSGTSTTIAASKNGYLTKTIARAITGDTAVAIELSRQAGPVASVFLPEARLSGTVYELVITGDAVRHRTRSTLRDP